MEKGFGNETIQRLISILGTHGDYEKEVVQIVRDNEGEGQVRNIWLIRSNGYKLAQKDDPTFLTEICTIIKEEPEYRQIVEEIRSEAANSLGIKLKKLEKDLLQFVGKEVARIIRQEVDGHIAAEKREADQTAKTRLCSLIRGALDAEVDHPTNR